MPDDRSPAGLSRRGALRRIGATPLALAGARAWPSPEPVPDAVPSPSQKPYWIVRADGSFDLVTPAIQLRQCYPAFDGAPIRPVSVKVAPGPRGTTEATYRLADGATVLLRFRETADTLVLGAFLRKMPNAPSVVQPLVGRVEGAARLFRQGLGSSGPSGFVDLDEGPGLWAHDSYLVTTLRSAAGPSLGLAARDHGRFLQRTTVSNRPTRRGLTSRHLETDPVWIEAGFSTERVPGGDELALPNLHLFYRPTAWQACRDAAEDLARATKSRGAAPPPACWCSWHDKGPAFGAADLRELLDGLEALSPRPPMAAIRIDAGYCPSPGDWLMPGPRWSDGGLQAAFDSIRAHGLAAGIQVAPFAVGSRSRLFREHPDWVLRTLDGSPFVQSRRYGPDEGLSDPEHYALDASHPEVVEQLRTVFRTLRQWGATVFATDRLDWGLADSARLARHDAAKTSVESFRAALQAIREEIGESAYWLAGHAPYAPCLGYVDAVRVANDASPAWSESAPGEMLRETVASQYANGVLWRNDPDAVILREERTFLSDDEATALALWAGILGGPVTVPDVPHRLASQRLALWRFLEPGDAGGAAFPYWERERRALRVAVRRYESTGGFAVCALNPRAEPVVDRLDCADLVGRPEAFAWEWGPGRAEPLGRRRDLVVEVRPHAARLYYLSAADAPPPEGLTLGGKLR